MQPRVMTPSDLDALAEIDGTIESRQYLHLGREVEEAATTWRTERRDLTEPLVAPNRPGEETMFTYRQVVRGIEEGVAVILEVGEEPLAAAVMVPRPQFETLEIADLRVDYDHRREGFGTVMMYFLISRAREREARALYVEVAANNVPGQLLLEKTGFELAGFDEKRHSNHDLVKEVTTLLWYLPLE